jgi:hypothetical protein
MVSGIYFIFQSGKNNTCFPFIKLSSKIFDLKVKGQGQTVIMMVRETLSHHYTTTYQISLTYLKRQKVIAQTQNT